jgi:hypothetical protein
MNCVGGIERALPVLGELGHAPEEHVGGRGQREPGVSMAIGVPLEELGEPPMRYRNLKRDSDQLNNGDYSGPDRQEQSGMDRNRLISDTGVATGLDRVEQALLDALVARRLGDVVGVRRPCCVRCRRSSESRCSGLPEDGPRGRIDARRAGPARLARGL